MKIFSDQALANVGHVNTVGKRMGCCGFVTAIGVGLIAWSGTHLYMCFCAPTGVWGFVQSLVVMDSTFCQMLMALIQHTQTIYRGLMIAFLFGIVGVIGSGVSYMTGQPEKPIGDVLEGRSLKKHL